MRGIPQQRDLTKGPLTNGFPVGGGPALPTLRQVDELPGPGADALKVALHLFFAALGHTPFFLLAAMEGHHHVVLFAAAQRVMHQVAVRPNPDAGSIPLKILGKIFTLHHRAVHHMASNARRIAHELLAHH